MCETISYLFSFILGVIAGSVGLYYKLYKDIKDFEEKYATILLAINKEDEV